MYDFADENFVICFFCHFKGNAFANVVGFLYGNSYEILQILVQKNQKCIKIFHNIFA